MSLEIIIGLPIIFGLGLLYWCSQLEEDSILRFIFQGLFIPLSWLSIHLAVLFVALNYPTDTAIIKLLSDFIYYTGWLMVVYGVYYLFRLLKGIYDAVASYFKEKKQQRYEDNED